MKRFDKSGLTPNEAYKKFGDKYKTYSFNDLKKEVIEELHAKGIYEKYRKKNGVVENYIAQTGEYTSSNLAKNLFILYFDIGVAGDTQKEGSAVLLGDKKIEPLPLYKDTTIYHPPRSGASYVYHEREDTRERFELALTSRDVKKVVNYFIDNKLYRPAHMIEQDSVQQVKAATKVLA